MPPQNLNDDNLRMISKATNLNRRCAMRISNQKNKNNNNNNPRHAVQLPGRIVRAEFADGDPQAIVQTRTGKTDVPNEEGAVGML
jgi:hypothetical protein